MEKFHSYRVLFLIILILIQILNLTGAKYSKSFNVFPPLYDFDDYDACLNSENSKFETTYCMIYAEIKPQNSSNLWRQISKHTDEYKFHYRRDRLFFGVCMERCKNFPKILDNFQYNNDSKVINKITQFFDVVHKRPLDLQMRSEYHELVHNCLNSQFQEKFGLNLRTYIEYCERPKETIEKDAFEKVLYKFLQIIIILNILSTLYDSCLKRRQPAELQNADYYKVTPQQPVSTLLTAFSIRRNYYRLVEAPKSQLGMDWSYLDGIRSISAILVIAGHAFFVQFHHVKNPEAFENFAKSPLHLWFTNGTLLLEVFHVLSGMLLFIKFREIFKITPDSSGRDCVKAFGKGMMMRYIRFLPSLALFISVNATFFTRLQDGPFWRHLTEPVRTFAREKWWKNLFIFDNMMESGFPHTWYMTTDWLIFAFYICVLIVTHKYPEYKRKIFTSLAILAVLIPLSICYFNKLEPCFLISPESFRYTHVDDEDVYYKLYTPFYTNLGGYLFGIICGEIYQKYCHNVELGKQISRIPAQIYELAFWISIAIGVWICWLGTVVIFQEPSIWTALYAGLNRNMFVLIFVGGFVHLGMFCKSLSILDFLSHQAFRIFARLSFQIYIWHFSVLYLLNGHKRQPVFTNHLHHATLIICLILFSTALAFIITIFVEYPFHKVASYYYKQENRPKAHHLKS